MPAKLTIDNLYGIDPQTYFDADFAAAQHAKEKRNMQEYGTTDYSFSVNRLHRRILVRAFTPLAERPTCYQCRKPLTERSHQETVRLSCGAGRAVHVSLVTPTGTFIATGEFFCTAKCAIAYAQREARLRARRDASLYD